MALSAPKRFEPSTNSANRYIAVSPRMCRRRHGRRRLRMTTLAAIPGSLGLGEGPTGEAVWVSCRSSAPALGDPPPARTFHAALAEPGVRPRLSTAAGAVGQIDTIP